jgi:hypothetical protein
MLDCSHNSTKLDFHCALLGFQMEFICNLPIPFYTIVITNKWLEIELTNCYGDKQI